MSRHDSQATTGESASRPWLRTVVTTVERNVVVLGAAAFFAATAVLGYVGHSVASTPFGRHMGALVLWFSLIFAVAATLLGAAIKLQAAVSKRLGDRA